MKPSLARSGRKRPQPPAPFASLIALLAFAAPIACASSPTPEPEAPPAPPPPEPAAVAPAEAPKPAPELSPEEKKKAQAAKELADERAKWEVDAKKELARWTPALRAEAKALSDAKYPNLKAGLTATLKGNQRMPESAARDKHRHPVETLGFFGVTPTMTVMELSPGEGWVTELIAPILASRGKLIVTTTDPNGPADARPTFYGQRLKAFLDKSPEMFGKVDRVVIDSKKPEFGIDGKVDMVIVMRAMHGWHRDKITDLYLTQIHKALKPNGVLAIEQHRAKAGADPDEITKKGYLPEAFVIKTVEAAGFKLAGKSEVNANPKDTTDHPEGVWTLPPALRLKDKDRQKYVDIGESDRMTLKFTKVAAKK
jgi:predicted methyltransferase